MGSVVFFCYTMLVLAVCFGSACVSAFAYASSGRRMLLFLGILFLVYTLETSTVFFNEFVNATELVSTQGYYNVDHLWLRTVLGTAAQACTQLAAGALLRETQWKRTAVTCTLFFAASILIGTLVPEGGMRQFVYYTLRQVGFAGVLIYLAISCHSTQDQGLRERLLKYKAAYFVIWALVFCIVLEDLFITLFIHIERHPTWLALFLSERNFSENILAGFMAYLTVRYALRLLSIRISQAPTLEKVDDLEQRVAEQMELFASANGLSERESQVLALVVLGKSNHEIAGQLYLAEGTVKKHVHNIMVKTATKDRESLTLRFWRG